MKQPKRLTRSQKEIISRNRLNPDSWMLVSVSGTRLEIIHKETGNVRTIDRNLTKNK